MSTILFLIIFFIIIAIVCEAEEKEKENQKLRDELDELNGEKFDEGLNDEDIENAYKAIIN